MQPVDRGRINNAEPGWPSTIKPDVDRIIVAAADELLGPVERIDQEIGAVMRRDAAGRDLLLGDDRNAGRGRASARQDDQLRGAVGLGDRRQIALRLDVEAAPDDCRDRRAGLARGFGHVVEQLLLVADQRGAIRIPPSRRTPRR